VGFVLSKMESAGNRVNILVLDACRDNPFSSSRSANRGLTVVEAPKGSLVVYATAPGSVAADGKGRNGVFTSAFLKNLEESPDMDIELFMRNVRKDVMAQTGNEQVPWTSSSLTESVAFKAGSLTEKSVTRPQTDNSITEAPENKTETTPKKEDTTVSTTKTEENPQLKASFDFILEYKGHTYYMSKQTATWNEAKEICEKNGGHLVTITSTEENEAIITCLKAKKINKDVWIGYTDSREERNWEWITGEESSFTYWAKNEPNNFNNTNEDYAQIWISTNPLRIWLYHWNDARQSSWSLFILEIE